MPEDAAIDGLLVSSEALKKEVVDKMERGEGAV
jgi:hypothetical protein